MRTVTVRVITGLMVVGMFQGASAATAAGVSTNGEIVVTATRDTRETGEIPARVTVLTGQEIRDAGYLSLADGLRQLAGLQVRSTSGNPTTADVAMRGFGENADGRVLVLLDGRRLNSPDMARVNWLQVPLSSVDRVEIVHGGNSSLYGNNALAGVINIITRSGAVDTGATVEVEAGSDALMAVRAYAAGAEKRLQYAVNGEVVSTDGYRENSAYDTIGGGASVGYDLADSIHATLKASYQEVDQELPGYLSLEEMKADPRQSLFPDDRVESQYLNADGGLRMGSGQDWEAMANLVFGLKDMASDIASWSSFSDTTIHSLGFMPKFTWDAPVADRANRLLLGVDAYLDALDVDRYPDVSHAGASSEAAIDRLTLGAYVRDELELGNSVSAALGGRVETARTEADVDSVAGDQVDESETQGVEAVDVSLLKRYGGASKVFAKVGTVYRYPFVDEQVSYIGFGTDDFYADLDPETGLSFDLGGAWAVSKDLVMDLTLFLLDMEDEISWNPVTYRNENLDQTRRQGAEAGANWQAASWVRLGGTFTFTDARFTEGPNDGQDVPLAPTYHSSGRLTLEPVKRTTLEAVVSHVGSSWLGGDYANEGPKLDDYVVTDAILRHTCANEALMFYFGVQNIFDVTYASLAYASLDTDAYYPEPGRVFKGGVRYQF